MKKIIVKLLVKYRKYISPIIRPACRFQPSCSEYAILAIKKYNLLIALVKILFRLVRCTPFTPVGTEEYP